MVSLFVVILERGKPCIIAKKIRHYVNLVFRAQFINPEWVELNKSRGYESYEHKLFMRYTGTQDFNPFLPGNPARPRNAVGRAPDS